MIYKNNTSFSSDRTLVRIITILKHHKALPVVTSGLLVLLLMGVIQSTTLATPSDVEGTNKISTYMLTTRGNLDYPQEVHGSGYNNNYQFGSIGELKNECPNEIAIFVHGWHNDELKAKERLDRVKLSLEHNNYVIPLIGFIWDSDKDWYPAEIIAKENGPKLAKFIINYVDTCKHQHDKDVNIRLISHSLGARVLLSTLDYLDINMTWNNNGFKITSVNLMGAAVDDEEVSKNPLDIDGGSLKQAYGKAIQHEALSFYNLFNPEDNILQFVYPGYENDTALGKDGRQQDIQEKDKVLTPPYFDIDVKNELEPLPNADGLADVHPVFCGSEICDEVIIKDWDLGLCAPYYFGTILVENCNISGGDNHVGYMGFRDPNNTNQLEDDGAINIVVENWKN
jgi:hypothetical protein